MKPLIPKTEIQTEVARLGKQVAADYAEKPLTILGVLTGSVVLMADLIRQIDTPLQIGLIHASSYRGRTTTPGELRINTDLLPIVEGRDVLLVDDIFDTGQTLSKLMDTLRAFRPNSLRSAVLLIKDGCSQVEMSPDYHCFRIPNVFVVGYGLDYNGEYRHLPDIVEMEQHDL